MRYDIYKLEMHFMNQDVGTHIPRINIVNYWKICVNLSNLSNLCSNQSRQQLAATSMN